MEHLSEQVREIALLDAATRIRHIESSKWIGYTRAMQVLQRMEHLLNYPPSHRMPNILLVGEVNNGKTALLESFNLKHRSSMTAEGPYLPVLMIEAPNAPDEQRLYNLILHQLMAPYRVNERVDKKKFQVMELFSNLRLKMLIIDELHNILQGSYQKQRIFLNVLKTLANQLRIVIVCAGIKDAIRALYTDPQLASRFEGHKLPKWQMDEEYLRLLLSFEVSLPLKAASNLHKRKDLAEYIFDTSQGTIGEISSLIKLAAIIAVESGEERITREILEKTKYVIPSQRRKEAESF